MASALSWWGSQLTVLHAGSNWIMVFFQQMPVLSAVDHLGVIGMYSKVTQWAMFHWFSSNKCIQGNSRALWCHGYLSSHVELKHEACAVSHKQNKRRMLEGLFPQLSHCRLVLGCSDCAKLSPLAMEHVVVLCAVPGQVVTVFHVLLSDIFHFPISKEFDAERPNWRCTTCTMPDSFIDRGVQTSWKMWSNWEQVAGSCIEVQFCMRCPCAISIDISLPSIEVQDQ